MSTSEFLTLGEVAALLAGLGLPANWVCQSSDRHWTMTGRRPAPL